MSRVGLFLAALAALPALVAAPATAACRVALTMALDVSSSVDAGEYALQINGLADALEDAEVRRAIFQVPGATVALQIYEWSGVFDQKIVQDWVEVRTPSDLDQMAARLREHRRAFTNAATGLGAALRFGLGQMARAPACERQKIDVSGDGQNNTGMPPQQLYTRLDFADVTVNGLAILSDEAALDRYYRFFVVRGPSAFVEVAEDFSDYGKAIRGKLIRELGEPRLGMR
ncbi:DUF1194 domain-containing protein [Oceanibium sediminis]|uniref:DUF1194 domain-containing protein n=1 Tax=Oceanibium sediminis TaxID=2026339 RepID=UPI000DD3E69E|nr:DUF1194 domain-containing protein [Oceanibium sediminis]